jgi:hypothetical protein
MRPVSLGRPSNPKEIELWKKWVEGALAELERATYEDLSAVAADFTVTNFTETRTLDASTATLADVADVLCTFIQDIRNRGMKRSQ